MYVKPDGLRFSPSDLTVFLDSEFASWMDHWFARQRSEVATVGSAMTGASCQLQYTPDPDDEETRLVASKGMEHERKFLATLKEQGQTVVEIERCDAAAAQTRAAMQSGTPVIYQGHLGTRNFWGYADFLVRQDGPSKLGQHHYEAWDTKLARSAKPYFIIQLCAYAEMLEELQGRRPEGLEIVLGTSQRRRFVTNRYFYYYRRLKRAFLRFHAEFDPDGMPAPGLCASFGRWSQVAEKILADSDHLSGVARITRHQIRLLEETGITTIAALAEAAALSVTGMDGAVFTRLKAQARLQIGSRGKQKPLFEVIPPQVDDPRRGLTLLPPPSKGDVFFDMEGFPLLHGGLEYLFGVTYEQDGMLLFQDWWAHDPIQEKAAFEGFIDWAHKRWQADRAMHIYHYAAYETTALRRLMGKYATREREVDDLLRNHVFVDLYTVVRQGLIVGTPSYSLKDIEKLYLPPRQGAVKTASGSIVAYQNWLESNQPQDWKDSQILAEIRDYNRIDCDSLWHLARWLRAVQAEHGIAYLTEQEADEDDHHSGASGAANPAKALAERLLQQVAAGTIADAEQRRIQELLAWLLEFHWREAKPVFWRMFDRHEMTEEQLCEDLDCLGGLQRTKKPPQPIRRSMLYQYRFDPDQDTKLGPGDKCFFAHDLTKKTTIETLDLDDGLVQIKIGPSSPPPPPRLSLIPDEHVSAKLIANAVFRYTEAWSQGRVLSRAVDDLLRRRAPRITRHGGGPIVLDGADLIPTLTNIVRRMEETTLFIQGPPGAGKTFTAAHVICELLRDGCRIGVMANSHKAILNLMGAIADATRRSKVTARLIKIGGDANDPLITDKALEYRRNSKDAVDELDDGGVVIGGSAWVFSREELQGKFDYLFIDEAGQVSLANIVGTGLSARNIVLIGDQMQLAQPIQGSHPGESGQSALDYLLQGRATIPPELGVFLPITYRMHPDVCRFISDAVYEGRLQAHPDTARQAVICTAGDPGLVRRQTGIVFVPVEHEGNAQASVEEVEVIARVVQQLLGRCVVTNNGQKHDLSLKDILIVAPYNMQVRRLQASLGPGARIGSVDKFQGQEAPVVIVSMCASSVEECPRGVEFLLNKNRINVAVSRAKCLAIVVGCPGLMAARCKTIEQMELVNLYCWLADYAESPPASC